MLRNSVNLGLLALTFLMMGAIFITSSKVDRVNKDISHAKAELVEAKEEMQILRAEWAYLTSPDILAKTEVKEGMHLTAISFWQVKQGEAVKGIEKNFIAQMPSSQIEVQAKPILMVNY